MLTWKNNQFLFEKQNQHITESAKQLIKRYLDIEIIDNPEIQIDNDLVQKSVLKYNINNNYEYT